MHLLQLITEALRAVAALLALVLIVVQKNRRS